MHKNQHNNTAECAWEAAGAVHFPLIYSPRGTSTISFWLYHKQTTVKSESERKVCLLRCERAHKLNLRFGLKQGQFQTNFK